jgi:hypothetical protein
VGKVPGGEGEGETLGLPLTYGLTRTSCHNPAIDSGSVREHGLNVVKVSVANVRVEHEVKLMDFTKWLDRTGGSPREVSDRHRIRSILGMPVPR